MPHAYDDILHLPRHVSQKHPQMAIEDRAAQFAPFAALTGYGAAIAETGRLTDRKIELDEYEKALLNEKLTSIQSRVETHPIVRFTRFLPDERKSGGAYVDVTGAVKRIDCTARSVIMADGRPIPFDDIIGIYEERDAYEEG